MPEILLSLRSCQGRNYCQNDGVREKSSCTVATATSEHKHDAGHGDCDCGTVTCQEGNCATRNDAAEQYDQPYPDLDLEETAVHEALEGGNQGTQSSIHTNSPFYFCIL